MSMIKYIGDDYKDKMVTVDGANLITTLPTNMVEDIGDEPHQLTHEHDGRHGRRQAYKPTYAHHPPRELQLH